MSLLHSRRAAYYQAASQQPGLLGLYTTNVARATAVQEVGGQVVAWKNQATRPGALPDFGGNATWATQPDGKALLTPQGNGLFFDSIQLPTPYTLILVAEAQFTASDWQGGNGGVLATSNDAATGPGAGHLSLLLYTGYGGTPNVLKAYAGNFFREGASLQSGRVALGIALSGGDATTLVRDRTQALTDVGDATLPSLYLNDGRVGYAEVRLYNYQLSVADLLALTRQAATDFNLP